MSPTRRTVLAGSLALTGGCLGRVARPAVRCPARVGDGVDARIGFGGDVMLGRGVDDHWRSGPPSGPWGSMLDRLDELDGLFVNLECCLSTRGEPRARRTYHFRGDPAWASPALRWAGVSWVCLANNHVLDFGRRAFADTRRHLADAGIAHAGAGSDLDAAIRPSVVSLDDLTVGTLALTDRSPSYAAGPSRPGTAFAALRRDDPVTRDLVDRALAALWDRGVDLVVASLHWGPNWVVRPVEGHRRFAHWLVDRGVDVVHGHSAHVVQGVEVYRGRPILYDSGDLLDDYLVKDDLHNDRSFLFELRVLDGGLDSLRLVPVEIRDETVHRARPAAARWLRDRMRTLSVPFETTVRREGDGLVVPLAAC